MSAYMFLSPLLNLFNFFFIVGPSAAYVSQYRNIRAGAGQAFSTGICLIIISSNVLRLCFWLGKQFDTVLVYQAILMIACHLMLLWAVVERNRTIELRSTSVYVPPPWRFSCSPQHFWQWSSFFPFLATSCFFFICMAIPSFLLRENRVLVEMLGIASLALESTLGLPQIVKNYRQGTAGLSLFLIAAWFLGDLFKTYYFTVLNAPLQFLVCGSIQICIDTIIIGQLCWNWRRGGAGTSYIPVVRDDDETEQGVGMGSTGVEMAEGKARLLRLWFECLQQTTIFESSLMTSFVFPGSFHFADMMLIDDMCVVLFPSALQTTPRLRWRG